MTTAKIKHENKSKNMYDLSADGCTVLENMFDVNLIIQLNNEFNELIKNKQNIQAPQNVYEAINKKKNWKDVERLDINNLKIEEIKKYTNILTLKDPLIKLPKLLDIGLNKKIIEEITRYLGIKPYLSFVKIRKSLINDLPGYDSQEWHIDGNGKSILKAFILLSDVDDNSGPTEYIIGSHSNRLDQDIEKRFSTEELKKLLPDCEILKLVGKPGTVYLADTVGFHRAGVPKKNERLIAIFNYVTQEEYKGLYDETKVTKIKISTKTYQDLSAEQKNICSLMEVI